MNKPLVTTSAAEQRDLDAIAAEENLTDKQKLFVEYLTSGQAKSAADAARQAGYAESQVKQMAWKNQQIPGVKRYLKACTTANLMNMQVRAVQVLGEVLEEGDIDQRTKVALAVLDRTGIKGNSGSSSSAPSVSVNIDLGSERVKISSKE